MVDKTSFELGASCQQEFNMQRGFKIEFLSPDIEIELGTTFKVIAKKPIDEKRFMYYEEQIPPYFEYEEEVVKLKRLRLTDDTRTIWCGYSKILNTLYVSLLSLYK